MELTWRHLRPELGFGGGSTCYRRMDQWQQAGVWERLHPVLLAELRAAGEFEWSRAIADSSHVQAKKGLRDGPEPGWPGQKRLQAPPLGQRDRDPARLDAHGWQPPRRHPTDPARRPCPAGPWSSRPSAAPTRPGQRRPRLRLSRPSPPTPPAWNQARDRAPQDRARRRPGPLPLGRRAHLRLAQPDETTARPPRTPRRDPRSIPRDRLLPDLLPTPIHFILKRRLRRQGWRRAAMRRPRSG